MKIDEGVNGKIHAKVRQILNSKASVEEEFSKWANAIYVQTEIPHFYC